MTTSGDAAQRVADRVRAAYEQAGLSPNRLAALTGMSHPTLRRRLESTPHLFTVDELVRIADATGVHWGYLLTGNEVAA